MNRQFSPRSRNRFLTVQTPIVLGGFLLIILIGFGVRTFSPGILAAASTPLWKGGSSLSSAVGNLSLFSSKAAVTKERNALREEYAQLEARNAVLVAQTQDLTALLGERTELTPGILASILVRPPVTPYDVLIVDRGQAEGVSLGAPAYGAGGIPIGKVGEVAEHTSRVTLYSAVGVSSEGWAGLSRIPVTLTGIGAGGFYATLPKEAGVVVGDAVYLPANGASPIGTITDIESDPSSPSVVLNVRPHTNPFSLTWITIGPQI